MAEPNFEKAKTTYRKNAFIQEKMAEDLVKILILKRGKNFPKIFEIGAGTGFLTEVILKKINFESLILNDLTENFTKIEAEFIKGDILEIEPPNDCDLIISNACFQWISDYSRLFLKLYKILNKDGILAFTTFGGENFRQIKDITGFGLSYPSLDEVIKNSGFKILYFEESLDTAYFKDVEEILKHIKYTGVKTANKIWTKSDLGAFKSEYEEKYQDSKGFELTYHPMFYILAKLY